MKRMHLTLIATLLFLPQTADADGFKLKLADNKIVGKNNEGIVPDFLFGTEFETTNDVLGTYETSHGGVDANDAGSGFSFPPGGPSDSFAYNIQGLWTYSGGVAVPASAGTVLNILKASDRSPLASIDGPVATPPSFNLAATSTHELLWSVPQSSATSIWGVVYTITGSSAASGLPFVESQPLVAVQWTPLFDGDPETAMQAIYAAAVPEPTTIAIAFVASLLACCFLRQQPAERD